jgi:hypothetical protein
MKKTVVVLLALLAISTVNASFYGGVVVVVDKKSFTLKRPGCDKKTFTFDPDMGKPEIVNKPGGWVAQGMPLGVTPNKIKVGTFVEIIYTNEKGVLVCKRAIPVVEHLGTREIDFAPMLAKGKETLPDFVVRIQLQSRVGLGSFRPQCLTIDFNEGASVKDVRDIVMEIVSGCGKKDHKLVAGLTIQGVPDSSWKVKEVGETKLLIEGYRMKDKDEPMNIVEVEVKKFPKERQPRVRRIDPRDPTKSLESDDPDRRASETKDRR